MVVRTAFGHTIEVMLQKGVRQGDPLSPIVFNIVVNALLKRLEKFGQVPGRWTKLSALGYADDGTLIAVSPEEMVDMWNVVLEFSRMSGMELCPGAGKTVLDVLNCKQPPVLRYKGTVVPLLGPGEAYKYLGFWTSLSGGLQKECGAIEAKIRAFCALLGEKRLTLYDRVQAVKLALVPYLQYHMQIIWWSQKNARSGRA